MFNFMEFLTGKILYICCPIPNLFEYWEVYLIGLLLQFKSTLLGTLKVQSCKLYNNKYMIVSPQITNTEIFAFIAVLVFKLLSRKVLFINRKNNRNC